MVDRSTFQMVYAGPPPPWDIDRPQKALVDVANRITGSVLDAGCGTGENALFLASQGRRVTGIDFLEAPIQQARRKAAERALHRDLSRDDALTLADWTDRFDAIVDSGLFHVLGDGNRARYVAGLATVLAPGGPLFLLCFSDEQTWNGGAASRARRTSSKRPSPASGQSNRSNARVSKCDRSCDMRCSAAPIRRRGSWSRAARGEHDGEDAAWDGRFRRVLQRKAARRAARRTPLQRARRGPRGGRPRLETARRAKGRSVERVRGKVVLLNVWASWCAPCKQELPMLDDAVERLRAKGVEIVAVTVDESAQDAEEFLHSRASWSLTFAHDPGARGLRRLDVPKMPTSYVIDASGVVREVHASSDEDDFRALEARLIELGAAR